MRNMMIAFLVAFVAAFGMAACDFTGDGDSPSSPTVRDDRDDGSGSTPATRYRSTSGCIRLVWRTSYGSRSDCRGGWNPFSWRNSCDFRIRVRYAMNGHGKTQSQLRSEVRNGTASFYQTTVPANGETTSGAVVCPGGGSAYVSYCTWDANDTSGTNCRSW